MVKNIISLKKKMNLFEEKNATNNKSLKK